MCQLTYGQLQVTLIIMESKLNIATWNLCLGLANKKEIVTDYLTANSIHACCLQETEIPMGFPEKTLNSGSYNIELEMNSEKNVQESM